MDSDEISSITSHTDGCDKIDELVRFEQQLKNRGTKVHIPESSSTEKQTIPTEARIAQDAPPDIGLEEYIPLSRIKERFIRWAKSMDTKNDVKSLMTSLTAILDTKSWSDNQNEVLYAALVEYETARQDCMPKEVINSNVIHGNTVNITDSNIDSIIDRQ